MTPLPRRSGWIVCLPILVLGMGRPAARAESLPEARPLHLVLQPVPDGQANLDADKLRADLERELGRPVVVGLVAGAAVDAGILIVAYRAGDNEVTVAFIPPRGEMVTRTVSPQPGEDVAALAVVLASDLARDQAAEVLGPPPAPAVTIDPVPAPKPPEVRLDVEAPSDAAAESSLSDRLRIEADVWTGNLSLVNVALRLTGQKAYALIGVSGHQEDGRRMAGAGLALGIFQPYGRFACEFDIGATYLRGLDRFFPPSNPDPSKPIYTNTRLISRMRAAVVFHVRPRFALFLGGDLAMTTHFYGVVANDYGPELFAGVRL